jgi:TatD DNase family protein
MSVAQAGMIDCHCHLADERCYADAEAILAAGRAAGVRRWILGGTHPDEWERQSWLGNRFPTEIVTNFGVHPWWVEKMEREEIDLALWELAARLPQADGLGETGLDFHDKRDASRFDDQKEVYTRQIQLAVEHGKPLVLHVVKAFDPALSILRKFAYKGGELQVPVVLHRFSGNEQQAAAFLELGAYLSFTGSFQDPERGKKSRRALEVTPLDRLLIETDGPDTPWAGLAGTYDAVGAVKNVSRAELEVAVRVSVDRIWKRESKA